MKTARVFFSVILIFTFCCGIVPTHTPTCKEVHNFLRSCSTLLKSLPDHTHPVFNLCTNKTAIETYHQALEFYRNMTHAQPCQEYLGHNRMNVYETIYNQLTGLWASANCDACASAVNETAEFMALSKQVQLCFATSTNRCESCDDDYQRVQHYYEQLSQAQHGSDRLCFDIVDRMNQTRQAWSGQYNCCKDKKRSMVMFASVASVACATPVLFYLLMHLVTVRQESRRIALLSAASGEDVTQASSSSAGGRREPQSATNRILETDDDGGSDAPSNDDDSDVGITYAGYATLSASMENNLNIREGNLINILDQDRGLHDVPQRHSKITQKPYHDAASVDDDLIQ